MRSHCYTCLMPKVVNVAEHKARIAAAVWRLVAGRGLDAVSLRSVAAEAGVSMGQVQHYFATKNDLLYAGVQHSYLLIEQELEKQLSTQSSSPKDWMLAILFLLLGGDSVVRDAIRVNVAFGARTQNETRIRELLTDGDDEIKELCAGVIAAGQESGHLSSDLDPHREARVLFALATGLGTEVAVYGGSSEGAEATFRYYVERLGLMP